MTPLDPPLKIMAQDIHRAYCPCGRANNFDVAAATAWNAERKQEIERSVAEQRRSV